jgi:Xaa-Pro aminopeptidase
VSEPILLRAAPGASADLFHAVPIDILDPFLYAEVDDRRFCVNGVLERDRIKALGLGIEVLDPFELGMDELLNAGVGFLEAELECDLRALRQIGMEHAIVPPDFPLAWADRLREEGMELRVDGDAFDLRRRVKTGFQLAGIRRAQVAADAAMAAAAGLLRELPAGLTCEQVREEMQRVCAEHEAELPETAIVAHGAQSAVGHEEGSGPIDRGEVVLIDIWPRDKASRCWADMTRTFVAGGGEPPAELAEYWRLTRDSLERVYAELRAGANGRTLYERSCEPYIEAGKPTQLTKKPGEALEDGYFHGLGHGVGLEIHERPNMGRLGDDLVAGDVVTVEPGCYRRGFGGCRLEDIVLITEDGYEVLTNFPYDL